LERERNRLNAMRSSPGLEASCGQCFTTNSRYEKAQLELNELRTKLSHLEDELQLSEVHNVKSIGSKYNLTFIVVVGVVVIVVVVGNLIKNVDIVRDIYHRVSWTC